MKSTQVRNKSNPTVASTVDSTLASTGAPASRPNTGHSDISPRARHFGRGARVHIPVLALYTLLCLFFTWPLAAHFTTHMPGDGGDDPSLAWNLWWIKHRLIDQVNLDFFHVDYMFYPIEINLAFYTLTPLNGLLSVPLQSGWALLPANNLILLSSFILGAYGVFLLVHYLFSVAPPTVSSTSSTVSAATRPLATGWSGIAPITVIAFVAGVIYAFASSKLFYPALGQFNIASSQWIPFCVLYLFRLIYAETHRARYRAATLAGVFLIFQAWAELTYASFLLVFAALVFGWWLIRLFVAQRGLPVRRLRSPFRTWLLCGTVFGGVFVMGIAPFLAAMLPDMQVEGDFFGMGGGFADTFSADLMGYLFPTTLHPWFGEWSSRLPFPNDKGQQIFVGYGVTLLAMLGVWSLVGKSPGGPGNGLSTGQNRFSLGIFWLVATLFFFLLTLGPHLRWAGVDTPVVGPFEWISRLPFFSGNRYPSRYGVMLMLCCAVLAAYGMAWLQARLRAHSRLQSRLGVGLFGLAMLAFFTFEHLSLPLPLNDARVPPIYSTLAQQPGDFAILELPTGWRNGARIVGKHEQIIMMQQWYQTVHGKRRLGGNTSRNPAYKFQYFTETPLIGDLIGLMHADREHVAQVIEPQLDTLIAHHRPTAGRVLYELGVRYVLIHTEAERTSPALRRFVEETLPLTPIESWQGTDWMGNPAGIELFALDLGALDLGAPDAEFDVDLRTAQATLYLAEGWSAHYEGLEAAPRLAHRTPIDLLLPAFSGASLPGNPSPTYRLTLAPHPNPHDSPNGPVLGLEWNGIPFFDWMLEGRQLTFTPPPSAHNHAGQPPSTRMNRLTLHLQPTPLAPQDLLLFQVDGTAAGPPVPDAETVETPSGIEPAIAIGPGLSILARSAGEEVGNFAHIYVNRIDYAPNAIGYNLVAVAPHGEVLGAAVFNTHADPAAGSALAHWLDQWPPGTLIAGAVADEGSFNLSAEAVEALARTGSAVDLRGRLRWSHAWIGAVGAPPGTAVEQSGLLGPASVGVGLPIEAPSVYGGVERIEILAAP